MGLRSMESLVGRGRMLPQRAWCLESRSDAERGVLRDSIMQNSANVFLGLVRFDIFVGSSSIVLWPYSSIELWFNSSIVLHLYIFIVL